MKNAKERIQRKEVNANVHQHYDPDVEFTETYFSAMLNEAFLEYMGQEDLNSVPSKHIPPKFKTKQEKIEWTERVLGDFIDSMVFPHWSGKAKSSQEAKGKNSIIQIKSRETFTVCPTTASGLIQGDVLGLQCVH